MGTIALPARDNKKKMSDRGYIKVYRLYSQYSSFPQFPKDHTGVFM